MMRNHVYLALAALALSLRPGPAGAAEKEDLKALVEEAIAARGGAARLEKLRAAVWKSEGVKPTRTSRAVLYGQLPGKFRLESARTEDGKTTLFVKIINGDRGWTLQDGKAVPMSREELAQTRDTFYHKRLDATLLPLRDKDVRLKALGESKVDGRAVVGVKVSRKGYPDVSLYFDKKTKLLLKSERQVMGPNGKPVPHELHYSDYKDHKGVKVARRTRVVVAGKAVGDVRITEFETFPKLDESLFLPLGAGDGR
jgi:hypothetical protein